MAHHCVTLGSDALCHMFKTIGRRGPFVTRLSAAATTSGSICMRDASQLLLSKRQKANVSRVTIERCPCLGTASNLGD